MTEAFVGMDHCITDEGRNLLEENRKDWERIQGLVRTLMDRKEVAVQ